jgi:hypothetical protein
MDDRLSRRLLRATVRIVPGGGEIGGCGTLIDLENRLVVTLGNVVGDRENARVYFSTQLPPENTAVPGLPAQDKEPTGIAGHVVFRDPKRGLVLLRLERLSEGAASLSLADQVLTTGQVLSSLHGMRADLPGPDGHSCSYSRGEIRQVFMPPHV